MRCKLVRISNNLGDAKSLITHPATTTHQRLTPAARAELGISDGLVRLSCGLEHPDDMVEDLMTALEERSERTTTRRQYVWTRGRAVAIGRVAASAIAMAERLGEAAIAPVVHVQPVGDTNVSNGRCSTSMPMPHQLEAVKHADMLGLGGRGDQRHHAVAIGFGDDPRRILRIDQHDVGAACLQPQQALMQ